MDELLIDEKKYVSSKQAAKMTGYAKDYIGQLCREGRVPARLVGRSWYVLESAIQDHRFGNQVPEAKKEVSEETPIQTLPWTRQSPRYEASPIEFLPTINRPKPNRVEVPVEDTAEDTEVRAPENLQKSWKAWFDRIGESITSVAASESPEPEFEAKKEPEQIEEVLETPREEGIPEDTEVNIPIHTIYRAPPREILPQYSPISEGAEETEATEAKKDYPIRKNGRNRVAFKMLKTTTVIISLALASVAIINTGLLDKFIVSISQVSSISGVQVYSK